MSLEPKRNDHGSNIIILFFVFFIIAIIFRELYPPKEHFIVNGTFTINVGSSIVINGTAKAGSKLYFEYSIHEIGEYVNFLVLNEKLYQDYLSFKEKRSSGENVFLELSRSYGGVLYGDPVLRKSSYTWKLYITRQNPEYYFIIDNGHGIRFGTQGGRIPHDKITITLKARIEN